MKYVFVLIGLFIFGCAEQMDDRGEQLSVSEIKILDRLAQTVLTLPDMPHERTRNRELAVVIESLIERGELSLATEYIGRITNWRAEELKTRLAREYLDIGNLTQAKEIVKEVEWLANTILGLKSGEIMATGEYADYLERYDDFRIDRVKSGLSQYYLALDDKTLAESWSADILPSEQAAFTKTKALAVAESDYDASLAINNLMLGGEIFEGKVAALDGLVHLYGLYFENIEKRELLQEKIFSSSISMPIMYRIDWLLSMSVVAHENGKQHIAFELHDQAVNLLSSNPVRPRLFFPLKSKIIISNYKIGRTEEASTQSQELYALYQAEEGSIFNIHRADVLVPCAEAFDAVGLTDNAIRVFKEAIKNAMINSNSRPRIEDLTVIMSSILDTSSIKLGNVEPDLLRLMESVGEPW